MANVQTGNLEAEKNVLGAMLMDEGSASIGLALLNEDHFSGLDPRNTLVFRAMRMVADQNKPVDSTTVNAQLTTMQLADEVNSPAYLLELIDACVNPDNIEHYAKIVRDEAVLRAFLKEIETVSNEYHAGKVSDISEYLLRSCENLNRIASNRSSSDFASVNEVGSIVHEQIKQYRNRSNHRLTGVNTGYERLNELTHGWQPGSLNIIAARPSIGKSAFAVNLIYNAAFHENKTVAFFSGEMPSTQIFQRMLAAESLVSYEKIQLGNITTEENTAIIAAIHRLSEMKIYFDDTSNPNLGDLVAKARKLQTEHPDLCAIFVDYLNIIQTAGRRFDSRSLEIAYITGTLKQLARDLNIPVIALAQLNRDADKPDQQGAPNLSNLKESGAIEQDADLVMMLYRRDYYGTNPNAGDKASDKTYANQAAAKIADAKAKGKDTNDASALEVIIRKNRNGKLGKTVFLFEKAIQKFTVFDFDPEEDV